MTTDELQSLQEQLAALTSKIAQATALAPTPPTAATDPSTPAPKSSYYNMDAAVEATFKAALAKSPKSRDTSYADKYDHVWCKGHWQVKGPKGGEYFVGRCVMGVQKGKQVKGILRISNQRFLDLKEGGTVDGWFRPDGAKDSVLIGELSAYKAA